MTRTQGSARRYAEAAFEVAAAADAVDAWLDQLRRAAEIVTDENVLQVLENPAIPFERRRELLERSLAGSIDPGVWNLVLLLQQRGRLELLPRIAAHFRRLLNARKGVTEGIVTSAAPLQEDEVRALTDRLERMTGGSLDLTFQIDPSLLGGVVVRLGDRLLDGSVRGRLERLRNQLVSGAL